MVIHVVAPGDTLYSIALKYGVSVESIEINNGLAENQGLSVGQALIILIPRTLYTVQPEDTLREIAGTFGTTVWDILQKNIYLGGKTHIREGESLVIDYYTHHLNSIALNGYTYTSVQEDTLETTLPFLSYISVFTYGISTKGELIPATDEKIISEAKGYYSKSIMLISTLTESGSFSNSSASTVLNDIGVRSLLIENIISTMKEKGYYGLDVDFEYVLPQDKGAFISFAQALSQTLHSAGFKLFISLAPKTSANQTGLLYESHDYKALGSVADRVLIMSYEWGYKYGPPMAISPLNKVKQVLEYAITEIPPEKIFMGLPNYAYDWTLPYMKNVTKAETISNLKAVQLAYEKGAEIQFDSLSKSPYFYYKDSSSNHHVVWFEDPRSYMAKAALAHEYGLGGISIWNILSFFPQGLLTLSSMYNINKL